MRFSVIVPVFNEWTVLDQTVPALIAAIEGTDAEVVYVCNGCHDTSATKIRSLANGRVDVLELPQAGKTLALNAGDAHVSAFPRFYLDADVIVAGDTFRRLSEILTSGHADLVAPHIDFDTSASTWLARAIAEVWLELPHAKTAGFHHLLGVSAQGRSGWNEFPSIIADDDFIVASVPSNRRQIATNVHVTTWPPHTFLAWARVRARWSQGQRQLARLGLDPVRTPGQRSATWSLVATRGMALKALIYMCNRLVSIPVSRWSEYRSTNWFQDRPQRSSM